MFEKKEGHSNQKVECGGTKTSAGAGACQAPQAMLECLVFVLRAVKSHGMNSSVEVR